MFKIIGLRRLPVKGRHFSSLEKYKVRDRYTTEVIDEVDVLDLNGLADLKNEAENVQKWWKNVSLADKQETMREMMKYFVDNKEAVGKEISQQMGKPLKFAVGEIGGLQERTSAFIDLAPEALATRIIENSSIFTKQVRKEPKGVVMSLAPWNYPLLTAVNSIIPALLSGNTVLLSHGPMCPLTSLRFKAAFDKSVNSVFGVQKSILSPFFCDYNSLIQALQDGKAADFVSFTGSTQKGSEIFRATAAGNKTKFVDCTLELGGSDASYIRAENDTNSLSNAVETVVDGGFFNSGQSCCGIERVFVHSKHYDTFIAKAKELTMKSYVLGSPMDEQTNLGPLARAENVGRLEELVSDAVKKGARVITGGKGEAGGFFQPTILADCNGEMNCMKEEVFGPLISVCKVDSDEDAILKINNSDFGLTASIFTTESSSMDKFINNLDVGTVFMNRADYLDPFMPWQGRKQTGKGCSLGLEGFAAYSNLKNVHIKH